MDSCQGRRKPANLINEYLCSIPPNLPSIRQPRFFIFSYLSSTRQARVSLYISSSRDSPPFVLRRSTKSPCIYLLPATRHLYIIRRRPVHHFRACVLLTFLPCAITCELNGTVRGLAQNSWISAKLQRKSAATALP